MKENVLRLSLALVLCLVIAACAPKQALRIPAVPPHEGPVTTDLLRRSVGFRQVQTLKALTDVKVFRNGEPAGTFSGVLGYKAPGSLKTGFFGPFGLTVMEMLVAKDLLQVAIPSRSTLYEWQSPDLAFLDLPDGRFSYRMEEDGDYYILAAFDAEQTDLLRARYLFDRTYLLNRSIRFYREGREFARVDFEAFNGPVPERTKVTLPKASGFELQLREPELDTEIPDDYFRPIGRGDMRVQPIQDLFRRFEPSR